MHCVPVPREEEPAVVDLEVREPDLVVRGVAVGAVHAPLLREAARVVVRQRLHQRHGPLVLGQVLLVHQVRSGSSAERRGRRRRREVGDRRAGAVREAAADVGRRVGDVGRVAVGEVRRLDRRRKRAVRRRRLEAGSRRGPAEAEEHVAAIHAASAGNLAAGEAPRVARVLGAEEEAEGVAAPEPLEGGRRATCGDTSRWHGGALHGSGPLARGKRASSCCCVNTELAMGTVACMMVQGVYVERVGVVAAGCLV